MEQNHIETQGGYSQVAQGHGGSSFGTQYSLGGGTTGSGSGGSIIDGLTDEQLVAVALQGGGDGANVITGPGGNSIEAEALQVSLSPTQGWLFNSTLSHFNTTLLTGRHWFPG